MSFKYVLLILMFGILNKSDRKKVFFKNCIAKSFVDLGEELTRRLDTKDEEDRDVKAKLLEISLFEILTF